MGYALRNVCFFFQYSAEKSLRSQFQHFIIAPPPAGMGCVCGGVGLAMQKILYGVAPPPDLIHYPLYTIFDRKGAPFIYLPLNKGLFIYFSSWITYPLISLRPENGRSVLLSGGASPYRPLHGVPPHPHFRGSWLEIVLLGPTFAACEWGFALDHVYIF